MRIAIWAIVGLAGFVCVIALIGLLLPQSHEASRSAELNKPPTEVFALIADPNGYKGWWDGASVKSEVVERVPPSKLVTKIVGETQFGGTWTFDIVPVGEGRSRVTITERGEIYNPIFRTLSRFVFGYTSSMESCLKAMAVRLG